LKQETGLVHRGRAVPEAMGLYPLAHDAQSPLLSATNTNENLCLRPSPALVVESLQGGTTSEQLPFSPAGLERFLEYWRSELPNGISQLRTLAHNFRHITAAHYQQFIADSCQLIREQFRLNPSTRWALGVDPIGNSGREILAQPEFRRLLADHPPIGIKGHVNARDYQDVSGFVDQLAAFHEGDMVVLIDDLALTGDRHRAHLSSMCAYPERTQIINIFLGMTPYALTHFIEGASYYGSSQVDFLSAFKIPLVEEILTRQDLAALNALLRHRGHDPIDPTAALISLTSTTPDSVPEFMCPRSAEASRRYPAALIDLERQRQARLLA
jgi:hypothetical protein